MRDIEWSPSRTGLINPVAIFEPVEIDGTIVEKATLHNISVIEDILGKRPYVGQKIWVKKANAIIPQIVKGEKYGDRK